MTLFEGNFTSNASGINVWNQHEHQFCKISFKFPRVQWDPGKFEWNFRHVIFKQILVIDGWCISCEIALIWMSLDFTDDQSTLVQVMAWCRQATSHYLSQCWPRSLSPYGITRPQWVNWLWPSDTICLWALCSICPASRTTLVATRFRVAVICPIIQVPHCIRVFFYFVWFVYFNHIFQFYYELCTYCNILDIYLS